MSLFGTNWDEEEYDESLFNESWLEEDDNPHQIPPLPLKQMIDQLSDSERLELFSHYCKYCGAKVSTSECYCRRDN